MASIRRTLSPSPSSSSSSDGHDLLPQTQKSPYLSSSSSSSNYRPSSPFRRLLISVMGLLLFFHSPSPSSSRKSWAAHHHHHHHLWYYHWNWNWKRSFLRFVLFFLLGFLLGFSPFAHLHDLKPHSFFDSIASSTSTSSKSIIDNNHIININNPHPHKNLVFARPTKMMMETETETETIKPRQKSNNNINNPTQKEKEEEEEEMEMNPTGDPSLVVPPPELKLKLLIVVTPTYSRALQAYYLNRLGQTLRLVPPPLLWIVVEMKSAASVETVDILRRTGVMYRHLVCDDSNNNNIKDRGVHQRNAALDHIQRHSLDGIVYFADDDNIYSLNLFHQLRNIRRFGTWPVAMLAQSKNKATLEGPVCNGSQVIGWHTNEKSKRVRRFHVDMSGFAFNSTILWDPQRWHRPTSHGIRQLDTVKEGFQETTFIEQVVEDESQMEGIPRGCSKIMNWHLHLEARHLSYPEGWQVSRNLDAVSSLG